MTRPIDGVSNWMTMFRWIVKLIRDEYEIEESRLVRTAVLETEIGLGIEQVEQVMATISESFTIRYPAGTLDEIVRLEELCMLSSWFAGHYKRPDFISDAFESKCRALNPAAK